MQADKLRAVIAGVGAAVAVVHTGLWPGALEVGRRRKESHKRVGDWAAAVAGRRLEADSSGPEEELDWAAEDKPHSPAEEGVWCPQGCWPPFPAEKPSTGVFHQRARAVVRRRRDRR